MFHLIIAIITHARPGQHFYLIFQIVKVRLGRNHCHTAACMVDTRLECKSPDPYLFPTQSVLRCDQLEMFTFARKTRSQTKVMTAFPSLWKTLNKGSTFDLWDAKTELELSVGSGAYWTPGLAQLSLPSTSDWSMPPGGLARHRRLTPCPGFQTARSGLRPEIPHP